MPTAFANVVSPIVKCSFSVAFQADLGAKMRKVESIRAKAFKLCEAGQVTEFQDLIEKQENLGPGLSVKLSDRQKEGGKSGATLLHMYVIYTVARKLFFCSIMLFGFKSVFSTLFAHVMRNFVLVSLCYLGLRVIFSPRLHML